MPVMVELVSIGPDKVNSTGKCADPDIVPFIPENRMNRIIIQTGSVGFIVLISSEDSCRSIEDTQAAILGTDPKFSGIVFVNGIYRIAGKTVWVIVIMQITGELSFFPIKKI